MLAAADLPATDDTRWADLLTPAELAFCAGFGKVADHLIARAAAKQAVRAVLGLPARPWPRGGPAGPGSDHDIEIRRVPGAAPQVVLTGEVERWRRARGLPRPGVSLSHAAGFGAALAWLPAP